MLSRRLLRIKVVKAVYAHVQCGSDNLLVSQKNLLSSVDQTYNLYLLLLQLPIEIANNIRKMQEVAKSKHLATYEDLNPNTRLIDSKLVHLLENSDELGDAVSSLKLNWNTNPEIIKEITTNFIESSSYKEYMSKRNEQSLDDDIKLMTNLFVEQLQNSDSFEDVIEAFSIRMSGDLCYALPLVMRTLTSIRKSTEQIKLVRKYKNEDDLAFVKTLFERAIINYHSYNDYIEKFTTNWDAERMVIMDYIIMTIAMAELINFPDIPVKVTLDEYIDISKYYSTQGSSNFVNGLLDIVSKSLMEEGKIKKTGRGLM